MKISERGINFLVDLESCILTAYPDSEGIYTIGFGNTFYTDGKPVQKGDKITHEEAVILFRETIRKLENNINRSLLRPLTQNQYDAIVAHVYNNGYGEFKRSKILKCINNNHVSEVPSHLVQYIHTRDPITKELKVNDGLINRVHKEIELFNEK